jgi:hypothetical protein
MRLIRLFASAFFVCALVMWLVGSFVAFDFDPAQWSQFGRFTAALVASIAALTITGILVDD